MGWTWKKSRRRIKYWLNFENLENRLVQKVIKEFSKAFQHEKSFETIREQPERPVFAKEQRSPPFLVRKQFKCQLEKMPNRLIDSNVHALFTAFTLHPSFDLINLPILLLLLSHQLLDPDTHTHTHTELYRNRQSFVITIMTLHKWRVLFSIDDYLLPSTNIALANHNCESSLSVILFSLLHVLIAFIRTRSSSWTCN